MTDRPSAATPEEVLADWRRQHRNGAADRQSEQWWLADHDFIDLIRRAQAAQRETITGERIAELIRQLAAAGDVAEEQHQCDDPATCTFTVPATSWTTRGGVTMSIAAEVDEFADALAAAIRAGE